MYVSSLPSPSVDNVMNDGGKSAFAFFTRLVDMSAVRGLDDENIRLHVDGDLCRHQMPVLLPREVAYSEKGAEELL